MLTLPVFSSSPDISSDLKCQDEVPNGQLTKLVYYSGIINNGKTKTQFHSMSRGKSLSRLLRAILYHDRFKDNP